MAERRSFSRMIIESGRMMKLPAKAQLLYVHLCMNADDDGVVEAFTVLPMLGAAEKELQCLEDKGFIRILNEDLVCFIVDWVENNPTRGDRIKPSIYRDLLMEKVPDARLQTVRARADRKARGTSTGRPMDAQKRAPPQTPPSQKTKEKNPLSLRECVFQKKAPPSSRDMKAPPG